MPKVGCWYDGIWRLKLWDLELGWRYVIVMIPILWWAERWNTICWSREEWRHTSSHFPSPSKHLSSLLTFPSCKNITSTQFAKLRQHHKLIFPWLDLDKLSSSENTSFAARKQNEAEIILSKKPIQRNVYCKSMTHIPWLIYRWRK